MEQEAILKNKVRILRPWEFKKIVGAIPKHEYKDKIEALLYTGARYSEMRALYKRPQWLQSTTIKMPKRKKKAMYNERYIRLNPQGHRAVTYFLRSEKNFPEHTISWKENLQRWAVKAKLDPVGLSVKTTRKTWESWLVTKYSKQLEHIFLSQGHTQMVALKYYLMIPFTNEDKEDMKYYTDGWI